jgi:hypothetical protein
VIDKATYQREWQRVNRPRRAQWLKRVREQYPTCRACGKPAVMLAHTSPGEAAFPIVGDRLNYSSAVFLAQLAMTAPLCRKCNETLSVRDRATLERVDLSQIEAPPW